jgi:hypothetical protein
MSLTTERVLNRTHATKLPMPSKVVDRVHQMARRQKMNPGLVFTNRNGQTRLDDYDLGIDEGQDDEDESYHPSADDGDEDDDIQYFVDDDVSAPGDGDDDDNLGHADDGFQSDDDDDSVLSTGVNRNMADTNEAVAQLGRTSVTMETTTWKPQEWKPQEWTSRQTMRTRWMREWKLNMVQGL